MCYLEISPAISDDDKEVYPNFVVKEFLELLYYGEQCEDVLMNVLAQKENSTINEYIPALDYYSKYDTFMSLNNR